MIRSASLGHLVLNVTNLAVSVPFYCRVLGLKEVGRNSKPIAFLSFGVSDHDIGLRQVGPTARSHDWPGPGLHHVAFRVGGTMAELRAFKAYLEANGVPIEDVREHVASTSIYFSDPDGIRLEAYIDHPEETWRGERQAVRIDRPVRLD